MIWIKSYFLFKKPSFIFIGSITWKIHKKNKAHETQVVRVVLVCKYYKYFSKVINLMVFSFLQRKCHPLRRWLKKWLSNPVLMWFFIWEEHNTNIKKGYTLCLPFIKKCLQSANFSTSFLNAFFYKQKQIF